MVLFLKQRDLKIFHGTKKILICLFPIHVYVLNIRLASIPQQVENLSPFKSFSLNKANRKLFTLG